MKQSTLNSNKTRMVLALNLNSLGEELVMIKAVTGIDYTLPPLLGSYKGETERSYVFEYNNLNEYLVLLHLAKHTRQESVLLLNEANDTALLFCESGERVPLGQFKTVEQSEALSHDAWSYSPVDNKFYLAS